MVGIFESSVNVLLLVLSVMLPIYQLPEQLFADEPLIAPFTGLTMVNFALSGTVLVASFHMSLAASASSGWLRR